MKKVLFIVGSLREQSFNMQLARKAAGLLQDADIRFLDYTKVPFMNQDQEYPVPAPVQAAREEVLWADGIWVVTPEYNHSYSGVVKNVIDWLSRPADPLDRKSASVIRGKKVTISGAAGNDAALDAREKMVQLANAIGMEVIGGAGSGVVLGKEAFVSNELVMTDEEDATLKKQASEFMAAI